MGIWVGGIFVKIALFLWCCVVSLGQAFNLQEYRPPDTAFGSAAGYPGPFEWGKPPRTQ